MEKSTIIHACRKVACTCSMHSSANEIAIFH